VGKSGIEEAFGSVGNVDPDSPMLEVIGCIREGFREVKHNEILRLIRKLYVEVLVHAVGLTGSKVRLPSMNCAEVTAAACPNVKSLMPSGPIREI